VFLGPAILAPGRIAERLSRDRVAVLNLWEAATASASVQPRPFPRRWCGRHGPRPRTPQTRRVADETWSACLFPDRGCGCSPRAAATAAEGWRRAARARGRLGEDGLSLGIPQATACLQVLLWQLAHASRRCLQH